MSVVETLRDLSEVWKLFGDMPDETTLNAELTALFLGISIKTLARYRQNGGGPPYVQYQSEDSKARNQRINYVLGDLRSWRDGYKVNNSMHAAQVRGLAFTSLLDFCEPQPFWTSIDGEVICHVLTISEEKFKKILLDNTNYILIWKSVEEVLFEEWESIEERNIWHKLLTDFLIIITDASTAMQEKMILKTISENKPNCF